MSSTITITTTAVTDAPASAKKPVIHKRALGPRFAVIAPYKHNTKYTHGERTGQRIKWKRSTLQSRRANYYNKTANVGMLIRRPRVKSSVRAHDARQLPILKGIVDFIPRTTASAYDELQAFLDVLQQDLWKKANERTRDTKGRTHCVMPFHVDQVVRSMEK